MVSNEPNFESFFNLELTQVPPGDWWVIPVDIQGSSSAISEGKAREVNFVASAAIAAIRNEFGSLEIPYVYGGDGATFLISSRQQSRAFRVLKGVQKLVRERLNIQLRVGKMSVDEIQQKGGDLRFGFLPIGQKEGFHFFRGNGLALAERELKLSETTSNLDDPQIYEVPNLEGLSCKLDPFKSTKDNFLSVIIEPIVSIQEEDEIFRQVIRAFCGDKKLSDFKPISTRNQSRSWISKNLTLESRLQGRSVFGNLIENIFATFLFRTDIKTNILGIPSNYTNALLRQSDWIKMDGSLRMIIETTHDEGQRLQDILQELFELGKLFFGIASSKEVLMTCHLQSAIEDRHTHFIDGGQAGLTRAAKELKKQKANLSST